MPPPPPPPPPPHPKSVMRPPVTEHVLLNIKSSCKNFARASEGCKYYVPTKLGGHKRNGKDTKLVQKNVTIPANQAKIKLQSNFVFFVIAISSCCFRNGHRELRLLDLELSIFKMAKLV